MLGHGLMIAASGGWITKRLFEIALKRFKSNQWSKGPNNRPGLKSQNAPNPFAVFVREAAEMQSLRLLRLLRQHEAQASHAAYGTQPCWSVRDGLLPSRRGCSL